MLLIKIKQKLSKIFFFIIKKSTYIDLRQSPTCNNGKILFLVSKPWKQVFHFERFQQVNQALLFNRVKKIRPLPLRKVLVAPLWERKNWLELKETKSNIQVAFYMILGRH